MPYKGGVIHVHGITGAVTSPVCPQTLGVSLLTPPLYGMIAFQRSELSVDSHNKKEAVSPQTVFCGGGAGTKWRSGYARLYGTVM